MDFKLENVLVSLHSLKTMGLGPFGASAPLFRGLGSIIFKEWRVTWTFSYTKYGYLQSFGNNNHYITDADIDNMTLCCFCNVIIIHLYFLFTNEIVLIHYTGKPKDDFLVYLIYRMTSLASCCARMVNQNKWPTLLHDRVDVTTRYNIYIYRFYLFTQGNNISNNRNIQTSTQRSCTNAVKLDYIFFYLIR